MSTTPRKAAKSESLTIRLDPKTRFMLEFVARLRGQTITTVVQRAIEDAAAGAQIDQGEYEAPKTWRTYWNVNEGVRALLLAEEIEIRPTFEEDKRLAFAKRYWPYFYETTSYRQLKEHYIDVLWPHIDELVDLHDANKSIDIYKVGERLKELVTAAGLAPQPYFPKDAEIPF